MAVITSDLQQLPAVQKKPDESNYPMAANATVYMGMLLAPASTGNVQPATYNGNRVCAQANTNATNGATEAATYVGGYTNQCAWLTQDGTIVQANMAGALGAAPVCYVLDNGTVTATCQAIGTVDTTGLTYGGSATLGSGTLILGGQTCTFSATLASQAAMLTAINALSGCLNTNGQAITITASVVSGKYLSLKSSNGPFTMTGNTLTALGLNLVSSPVTNAIAGALLQVGDSNGTTKVKVLIGS